MKKRLLRIGREEGAPSAIEAATSVAAPLGNLVQQIAETLVTCESKSLTREAEKERQAGEAADEEASRSAKASDEADKKKS